MHGHRRRHAIGAVLTTFAVGALFAAGNAGADLTSCSAKASRLSTSAPARSSAAQTFDDYVEDVNGAPDICGTNLVTNDNESVTIAMHIHDRSAFAAGDAYRVILDTDANTATGGGAETGATAGAEYVIEIADGVATLRKWGGTTFDPVLPTRQILTDWIEDYGPFVSVARVDLGNAPGFQLRLQTSNGTDLDLAPDSAAWAYTLSPLALTAGKLKLLPAKAGKPFLALMQVTRSDFDIPLEEGTIACRATLGGKPLAGRGAFVAEHVACTWRLPKNARGKQFRGSVAATLQGVTAKRPFTVRVS